MVQFSTVKRFFPDKGYGFIANPSQFRDEDFYFRIDTGQFVEINNYQIVWKQFPQGRRIKTPQVEDEVAFEAGGQQGTLVLRWTTAAHYRAMEAKLAAAKAKRPTYRVWERSESPGGEAIGEPTVKWEGSDLSELLRRHPLPTGRQSPSADPLLSYYGHDDFSVRRWWEKREAGSEEWERCEDPRPLPGVLRQFKRINWR